MGIKKIVIFLLISGCLSCFAARCTKCYRNLIFADNDKVCNVCEFKHGWWKDHCVAIWKFDYLSNSEKDLYFFIFSAKTDWQNRNDDPVIVKDNTGKLRPIQNYKLPVDNDLCLMFPLKNNNGNSVNVLFLNGQREWMLKNVPLATRKNDEICIDVKKAGDYLTVVITLQKNGDGYRVKYSPLRAGGSLDLQSLDDEWGD